MEDLFIAVEGPIGVGKTTLMQAIADAHGLRTQREIVGENPFLADFYVDIPRWAFQTEMFFLTSRYTQLRDLGEGASGVVADFHIAKNLVFARRTLGPVEHERLVRVYDVLVEGLPVPDVTVFLDAELPALRARIAGRGRGFEAPITDRYLLDLRDDYRDLHEELRAAGAATVLIDTTDLDVVRDDAARAEVLARVEACARTVRPTGTTQETR